MAAIISPNMSLPVPSVGTTQGPDYATNVNNSLTLIDQHDHTPGKGVQITPAGLNINDTLSMNDNSLIDITQLVLVASNSASTTPLSLSVAPGGESPQQQDLWYTPNTGVPIQITKNGAVNVVASSIEGETYAAGTFFWTQAQDALPTTPANFDIGSIVLRPNVALTMLGVVLQPASAIASQYSINLPLIPSVKNILTLDTSGNMVADTNVDNSTIEISSNTIQVKNQGITAAKILNNTITTNQISLTAAITKGQLANAAFNTTTDTVTATGTYTVPSGVNRLYITAVGGGGGGGSGGASPATSQTAAGGGGAGGGSSTGIENYTVAVTPGESIAVTVGAAGVGGASTSAAGVSGTTGGSTIIVGTFGTITIQGGILGLHGTDSSATLTGGAAASPTALALWPSYNLAGSSGTNTAANSNLSVAASSVAGTSTATFAGGAGAIGGTTFSGAGLGGGAGGAGAASLLGAGGAAGRGGDGNSTNAANGTAAGGTAYGAGGGAGGGAGSRASGVAKTPGTGGNGGAGIVLFTYTRGG